ncbi:MAG: DNA methyltransferase, partial [Pseudonocardiaceae bacterium]
LGKNPGDVWRLATANYRGAHFATFPAELVRRPLLATTPERVCLECGAPWMPAREVVNGRELPVGLLTPACGHVTWRPGRVLDPFMGAGTVAITAEQHRRDWVGIELNPAYAQQAEQRITAARTEQIAKGGKQWKSHRRNQKEVNTHPPKPTATAPTTPRHKPTSRTRASTPPESDNVIAPSSND